VAARFVGHPGLVQAAGILLGLAAGIGAAIRMLLKEIPWTR